MTVTENLRLAGAYRRLLGMEVQAHTEGASTHYFPPCCHGLSDKLTVAAVEGGYEYLWVDGPVSRDAAARILATDA